MRSRIRLVGFRKLPECLLDNLNFTGPGRIDGDAVIGFCLLSESVMLDAASSRSDNCCRVC